MNALKFDSLVRAWDEQQSAYITHREQRFGIMLDAVAHFLGTSSEFGADGEGATVLDLACGPGSVAQRLLDRFSAIRVIGVDYDPVLLHIARSTLDARHPGRFTEVDADLVGDWAGALDGARVQLAVSTTALHWLAPHQLVRVYAQLGQLLPEGGLFLNGDHLRYDPQSQRFLRDGAAEDDARTQQLAYDRGVLSWEEWWELAERDQELAALCVERERRFSDRPPTADAPLELHLHALRTAGFSETGVLWRFWDDVVVLARR